eukprot:COSAG02_NODE_1877_length_10559_cov_8.819025_13_plen_59_part_00
MASYQTIHSYKGFCSKEAARAMDRLCGCSREKPKAAAGSIPYSMTLSTGTLCSNTAQS